MISFAKFKSETIGPLSGNWNPLEYPVQTILLTKAVRGSIAKMKRNGDKGQPCLTPLVTRNSSVGDPFNRIEALEPLKHSLIQLIHKVPNPHILQNPNQVVPAQRIIGFLKINFEHNTTLFLLTKHNGSLH